MSKTPNDSSKEASTKPGIENNKNSHNNSPPIQKLIAEQLADCQLVDQFELSKLKSVITKRQKNNQPVSKLINKAQQLLTDSMRIVEQRKQIIPKDIEYDLALPVCQARDDVRKAVEENQDRKSVV